MVDSMREKEAQRLEQLFAVRLLEKVLGAKSSNKFKPKGHGKGQGQGRGKGRGRGKGKGHSEHSS